MSICQFQFSNHGNIVCLGIHHRWDTKRHSRAHYNHIRCQLFYIWLFAPDKINTLFCQMCCILRLFHIGQDHLTILFCKKFRTCNAAACSTDYQYILPHSLHPIIYEYSPLSVHSTTMSAAPQRHSPPRIHAQLLFQTIRTIQNDDAAEPF